MTTFVVPKRYTIDAKFIDKIYLPLRSTMQMNLNDVIYKLNLPIWRIGETLLSYSLKNHITHFKEVISKLDDQRLSPKFYFELHKILDKDYSEDNYLVSCLRKHETGYEKEAKELFDFGFSTIRKFVFDLGANCFMSDGLYRVAYNRKDIHGLRRDLFHPPYTCRSKIKAGRFNPARKPCLYLATSINVCWLEMGMPLEFYVSRFWQTEETIGWKILFLLPPQKIELKIFSNASLINAPQKQEAMLLDYFAQLPLILACSYINDKRKCGVMPDEYYIPQLLMEWIFKNGKKYGIMGIAHYSDSQYAQYQYYNGFNVVLPAWGCDENNAYSPILEKAFILTKPKFVEVKEILKNLEKTANIYFSQFDKYCYIIDSPNWGILRNINLSLRHFINGHYINDENLKVGEPFYAMLCSLCANFSLLYNCKFYDVHGKEIADLNSAVHNLSNELDKLVDDMLDPPIVDVCGNETTYRQQFGYIENDN